MDVSRGKVGRNYLVYSLVLLSLLIAVFLIIFLLRSDLTGKATLSLASTVIPGDVLDGSFELNPAYIGSAIPVNSVVAVSYGNSIRSLYLKDLLPAEYLSNYAKPGLTFTPDIKATVVYYPDSYFNAVPQNPNVQGIPGDAVPPTPVGDDPIPPTGLGSGGGRPVVGNAIVETDKPFSLDFYLKYGFNTIIPSYPGRIPKVYSVSLRDKQINKNYVLLTQNAKDLILTTSYYETLEAISMNAPSAFFELKKFNFIAKESTPVTLSLVYLGQAYFSAQSDVNVKNIAPLDFGENSRVLVNSEEIPSEAVVVGDSNVHVIAVGPTITPDLFAAGCSAYVCGIPSECTVSSLEALNRGVLVPVQISYCHYTDCGVSFQITKPCEPIQDQVDVKPVDNRDLGLSGDSSSSGGGSSSVVLIDRDNSPRAVVTSHEGTLRKDFTFLQSPPNFGDECKDGIQNNGETGPDCGGSCMSCSTVYPDYSIPALGLGVCTLGILFFVLLLRKDS